MPTEDAADTATAGRDDRPLTVLVVDDDPRVRDPLCAGLRRYGFELFHDLHGRDQDGHLAVLLDVRMPGLDGRSPRPRSRLPIPECGRTS
ncbi:hypothetical protein J0H58_00010 [bacterium]|nr:hypothetical protein [bacterium]